MDKVDRKTLRRFIQREWQHTVMDYRQAGAPFGHGRGLEIWIEYGELTTVD